MTAFFLIWQDPETRKWYPVGKLERFPGVYTFVYTRGSLRSEKFVPFGRMDNRSAVYVSQDLFPIFANRVMNERRPEYSRYASWSDMDEDVTADPLLLMATMGGGRVTDTLQVYRVPERTPDGIYRSSFFMHGIDHLPESSQNRVFALKRGEKLYPLSDHLNPFDENAVALRTEDPTTLVGYCPRHLAIDIRALLLKSGRLVEFSAIKVNSDAPLQFRLLCRMTAVWPDNFIPCDRDDYKPLAEVGEYDKGQFYPENKNYIFRHRRKFNI